MSFFRPQFAAVVILCAFSIGCTTAKQPEPAPLPNTSEPAKTWSAKMQSLSQTLASLLPLVVSRARFNNPKNFATIEANTKQLQQLTHTLKNTEKNTEPPNQDPTMRVVTGLFDEDISRALLSLQNGDLEYARQTLSETTSYCIQCHTQTSNGPDFPRLDLSLNARDLPPIDQAEFFAATRQFDRAIAAYKTALSDEAVAKRDLFQWDDSARSALAIIVRVKNDPAAAADFTQALQDLQWLPASAKQTLSSWKTAITQWSAEPPAAAESTDKQILDKAESLLKTAKNHSSLPLDHGQEVVYFRASGLLHDLLQRRNQKDELTARALLDAGLAAEATRDMNFWTLHESYYEQCIRTLPHSKIAANCFQRLNDSMTLAYSGSGGVRVPSGVTKRLDTFRVLARTGAKKMKRVDPVNEPRQ